MVNGSANCSRGESISPSDRRKHLKVTSGVFHRSKYKRIKIQTGEWNGGFKVGRMERCTAEIANGVCRITMDVCVASAQVGSVVFRKGREGGSVEPCEGKIKVEIGKLYKK